VCGGGGAGRGEALFGMLIVIQMPLMGVTNVLFVCGVHEFLMIYM
jgi:hypothetical protein